MDNKASLFKPFLCLLLVSTNCVHKYNKKYIHPSYISTKGFLPSKKKWRKKMKQKKEKVEASHFSILIPRQWNPFWWVKFFGDLIPHCFANNSRGFLSGNALLSFFWRFRVDSCFLIMTSAYKLRRHITVIQKAASIGYLRCYNNCVHP